jgi:hypothetical protein
MKIYVKYIFREDNIDPIYQKLGLSMDTDEIEITEEGVLDLAQVVGASQFYELTQVYCCGGHVFYIDLPFNEFKTLWMS